MIVGVIAALGTLFWISIWCMVAGYVAWAGTGTKTLPGILFWVGVGLFFAGCVLSIRVLGALLGVF